MFVNAGGQLGLFENGLRQNVILLYRLFRAMPDCAGVWLLNAGDAALAEDIGPYGVDPGHVVDPAEMIGRLDLVIVAGGALDPELLRRFRAGGCRTVSYKGGNGAVISMEAMLAKPPRPDAERYFDVGLFDAVWLTPQHWPTYRGWCESLYRCPVLQVPQIWSPLFVEAAGGPAFGYRPGDRPWRVGVMDPNATVMKTSHLPMLVCEAAFRARPDRFAAFYIANGQAHRDNPHFAGFTSSLMASKAGRLTLEPRFVGVQFLANHCDAVVSHQWENALNYAYWEALHGGYPLIHNSPMLDGLGYRYADFDAEAGAAALLSATERHDDDLPAYRDRAGERIAAMAPEGGPMIAAHAALAGQALA